MRLKLPPYVQAFTDRHGKARFYFRRHGVRVPLPGVPYSIEFMEAHGAAMSDTADQRPNIGVDRTRPGTMDALSVAYLTSADFKNLRKSTQTTYRGILDRFRAEHGGKGYRNLERHHIARLVSAKASTPAAAHNLLRMLRALMKFAVSYGYRKNDPSVGVRSPKLRSEGFYTWTEADIAKFEARHPIGSRARLALTLLLCTAQRRSDIVKLGRQHIQDGYLVLRQQKTGMLVEIPVHRDLRAAINKLPKGQLIFLLTEFGKPFTAAGFGNYFRQVCDEAGLPKGVAAHGLRKAAARRLAEAGCSAHEIAAITGHKTLKEVARYTEAADRKKMASSAMEKSKKRTTSVKPIVKPSRKKA